MKYGILTMDTPRSMYNIGDAMQILAIRNLYRYCDIPESDIVSINVSKLSSYQGEPVLLPINYPLYGYYTLSENITPLYLGVSIMSSTAAKGLRMDENEPVGCRDEFTFTELQRADIDCYYAGCMTLTLPQREHIPVEGKVLFVDVPESVKKYIPEEYLMCAEFLSHIYYKGDSPEKTAEEQFQYYCEHAKLVVTSRIHCALPSIAAGIPTIFVCDRPSFRYSVLKSFIPIYTSSDFHAINWNPLPISCEDIKKSMLEYAKVRVASVVNHGGLSTEQNEFYQKQIGCYFNVMGSQNYENVTIATYMQYLRKRFSSEEGFRYILWGITQLTELMYQKIQTEFPNAVFDELVDEFKDVKFHERCSVRSKAITNHPEAIVLVTAGAASISAQKFLSEHDHKYYCICYGGIHVEDGEIISFPGSL